MDVIRYRRRAQYMNIREALQWARSQLPASPTPYEDARLLLQHVLATGHTYVASHPEQDLSARQDEMFRALVARAARLEPIPYLIGEAEFCGLSFQVTPAVLIPRPETELLVEAAINYAERTGARSIVDVGTGSGCIAVMLARRLPSAQIIAVDVSEEALSMARRNIEAHGVGDIVQLRHSSILQAVGEPVDLIVANLPYISDAEWTMIDDGVKWYEPVEALRGGPDGLDLIETLLQQAKLRLRPQGAIFLEIGWQQGDAARQVAKAQYPTAHVIVEQDYSGLDRLVLIET